ncbi:MAG: hypothetical protein ABL958_16220 [Bdellovibrionia bacterium]
MKTFAALLFGTSTQQSLRYKKGQWLALYGKQNEERKIREVLSALDRPDVALISWPLQSGFGSLANPFASGLRNVNAKDARKIWRILKRLSRRHPLYVVLRASAILMTYARVKPLLAEKRPAGLVLSTATNPHGLAFMALGRSLGIPVVYVSHGAITQGPAKLWCSLGLFHGRAAHQLLLNSNSEIGSALFYGFKDEYRPIEIPARGERIDVCVCLSKDFELRNIRHLVDEISRFIKAARIRIRGHPDSIASISADLFGSNVVVQPGTSLEDDLKGCSFAVCGSSTVHLEVLLRGVPTFFAPNIDWKEPEPLLFIRQGLIPEWNAFEDFGTMSEILRRHYTRPDWEDRFSQYMNVVDRKNEFGTRVARDISLLAGD